MINSKSIYFCYIFLPLYYDYYNCSQTERKWGRLISLMLITYTHKDKHIYIEQYPIDILLLFMFLCGNNIITDLKENKWKNRIFIIPGTQ